MSDAQLAAVEVVAFDNFDVYFYAWRFWDGETGEFAMKSLAGLDRCVNLRTFFGLTTSGTTDLAVLGKLRHFEQVVLEPGPYTHGDVLLGLPALREVQVFGGSLDDALLDALRAKGTRVVVYE